MTDAKLPRATTQGSDFEIALADETTPPEAATSAKVEQVPLASITRDPELNARASGVNKRTVKEYAAAGATFPPVVVFKDAKGKLWLADGFHRCAAAELAERTEILAEIHEGGRREALLFAVGANQQHGLRRSHKCKRRAVQLLLGAFPKKSDRWVAEACGVGHQMVATARRQQGESSSASREGADGRVRRGRAVNVEREVDRVAKAIDRLIARWPAEDTEGRGRFIEVLHAGATRLAGPSTVELAPETASNPVKRTNGEPARKATKGKVAA